MEITNEEIGGLVSGPSENLNVEIKGWIDPTSNEGVAKIIKAVFSLRNRNGGFLVVGFNDRTLLPDTPPLSFPNIHEAFHPDKIQGLISRYASVPFEARVGFGKRDEGEFPVIKVDEGVRAPVAVKRDLENPVRSGNFLFREGDVYFRTLESNGTPSTAKARPSDWPDIVEICFENREADIGRFLRRHLSGREIATTIHALAGLTLPTTPPPSTLRDRALALLESGESKFQSAISSRQPNAEERAALEKLTWQVALVADPVHTNAIPDQSFLNTALGANPRLTGWPIWLDSRGFGDQSAAPRVIDGAWQSLIVSLEGWSKHIDFMRLDPVGAFYLRRLLQDDLSDKVTPGTALDVVLMLLRVVEAFAVGLNIVKALGWDEAARVGFAFRWTKLDGRELSSWANPMIHISGGHISHTDAVTTFVELPADTPISAIAPYVEGATRDLFVLFDGYTLPTQAVEEWTQRLIERRLS